MADTPFLPGAARIVAQEHPEVWDAFTRLGEACSAAGPLDGRTRRLLKVALAVGAASVGGTHSHVRQALAEDVTPEELEQIALLCIPTLGFPHAVAALTWIRDLTGAGPGGNGLTGEGSGLSGP